MTKREDCIGYGSLCSAGNWESVRQRTCTEPANGGLRCDAAGGVTGEQSRKKDCKHPFKCDGEIIISCLILFYLIAV